MKNSLFLPIFLILIGSACTKDKETTETIDCSNTAPTYTLDVKPILDANCATSGCHDAATKKDGKDFSTYESTIQHTSNDAFLGAIQHKSGFSPMPRNAPKLSDADIKTLTCWVENGVPE